MEYLSMICQEMCLESVIWFSSTASKCLFQSNSVDYRNITVIIYDAIFFAFNKSNIFQEFCQR